jgi:hypothetical protein
MGKGVRIVLPACFVTLVRKHFPDETYTGFREVMEVEELLEQEF